MYKRYIYFGLLLILSTYFTSCNKAKIEPLNNWGFKTPTHFPEPHYKFENNKQTYDRFDLGRDLFYDPILSLDSSISCASCHTQTHGFADHNVNLSLGVNGTPGKRNSPALSNLAWYPSFMWDGGVNHIEIFSFAPITNPLEMHEDVGNVVNKLNSIPEYKAKFKKAYGNENVTDQHLLKALAQFMAMMISADSKYDKFILGTASFNSSESAGYELFQQYCASCHQEPLTTDFSFRNNGIDATFTDLGRALITLDSNDEGKFRVPSLRNITLTYPYMHDGRFFTLSQVLDHYSNGVNSSSTLDPSLGSGFNFTQQQKNDIINFLYTLTDQNYLSNGLLSEKKH
jgi:cytochrome c peroxidase